MGRIDTGAGYWKRGNFTGDNPWANGAPDAPFDQHFHLIVSMPTGGTTGFYSDSIEGKPWSNRAATPMRDFWENRKQWLPSWNLDKSQGDLCATMKVDWIRVYAL